MVLLRTKYWKDTSISNSPFISFLSLNLKPLDKHMIAMDSPRLSSLDILSVDTPTICWTFIGGVSGGVNSILLRLQSARILETVNRLSFFTVNSVANGSVGLSEPDRVAEICGPYW